MEEEENPIKLPETTDSSTPSGIQNDIDFIQIDDHTILKCVDDDTYDTSQTDNIHARITYNLVYESYSAQIYFGSKLLISKLFDTVPEAIAWIKERVITYLAFEKNNKLYILTDTELLR